MTRKHFEAIASIISDTREQSSGAPETTWAVDNIAQELANYFSDVNPNFDWQRFMAAAGVEDIEIVEKES